MRALPLQRVRIPRASGGVCRLLGWLAFALVIFVRSALAQEPATPVEPMPITPGPPSPSQERLLSPIPQRFDWIRRDVRPNPLLESSLALRELRSQLLMSVTLAEDYFDNYNFDQEGTDTGEEEDGREEFRTSLTLGTVYRLEKERWFVSLANSISGNYEARAQNYNIGFANLALNLGYELPRVSFALSDNFVRDDDVSQTSSSNIREGRQTFTRNSITPQIRFSLSRLTTTTLAYTNTLIFEEDAEQNPSISHAVTTGLQHRFSRRLSGNFGYGFTTEDDEDAESRTHNATADLAYLLSRRTALSLQTFSNFISRSGEGTDSQDYGFNIGIRQQLSAQVDFFAAAGVTITDLEGQGLRADPNWQATLDATLSARTSLSVSTQGGVGDTGGEVDNVGLELTQSVNVTLEQVLSRALRVSLFAGYTHTEFLGSAGTDESDPGREDDFWQAGARTAYALSRVWSLSLNYQYQRRNSNRAEDDFDANQVTLAITGSFPVL